LNYELRVNKFDIENYRGCVSDLVSNDKVRMMKQFKHHYHITCFQHCVNVSLYSYLICRDLGLDYISAARGGLLHDLFLYDWRTTKLHNGKHAFVHSRIALDNANKIFLLNEIEQDIIEKHMWPLTIKPPRYREAFIVCFVDKYCACKEILGGFIRDPARSMVFDN